MSLVVCLKPPHHNSLLTPVATAVPADTSLPQLLGLLLTPYTTKPLLLAAHRQPQAGTLQQPHQGIKEACVLTNQDISPFLALSG